MGQSASLYSISPEDFKRLRDAPGIEEFDLSQAKNECVFPSTFMGLEFVLAKSRQEEDPQLISEIFTPSQMIGHEESADASDNEQFELLEEGSAIPYLDPALIKQINGILQQTSESDIEDAYDADEMNDNGIYPGAWSDEEEDAAAEQDEAGYFEDPEDEELYDPDEENYGDEAGNDNNHQVLGKALLVQEFKKLQSFIDRVARDQHYILVFVG